MFSTLKSFNAIFAFSLTAALISFSGSFNSATAQQSDITPNIISLDPDAFSVSKGVFVTGQNNTYLSMPFSSPAASFGFIPATPFFLTDTLILPANPGPANNGGSAGWAIFFDLIAGPNNIIVTQMKTANTGAASASFTVEVFTRTGTALGGPVGFGPGSSTAGWTSLGTVPVVQGSTSSGISLVFTLPSISVSALDTVGVAIRFNIVGPRYFGTGSPSLSTYSDSNLTLITGDARSAPFTPTGSWFSSRALTGEVRYVIDSLTGISKINTEIPDSYRLAQNYPNPFNPSTTIEFSIPEKNNVSLKVYNTDGQLVATLVNSVYTPGTYKVQWNAANFASGVYFYSLQAGKFTQTKKMILIK